jgi:1,4-dihydroxy-6-naphthoate synthase
MKLTLGYSPCPNDTFIFDALVNNKIKTDCLEFDINLEDVETLNQWAFEGKLDITKLSFPALFQNLDKYILLSSGAALGKGVGPLLIKNEEFVINNIAVHSIAIPGINTTANLLLSFAYPEALKKIPMLFSEIENAVLSGKTDLGVLIHENRFTYEKRGLKKITDLGTYWEEKMNVPVPLGGIAIKKSISPDISLKIESLIRKSIKNSFTNYPVISEYVKRHAQEMNEEVMRQHIELYVNNFSSDLGSEGKKAIETLYKVFYQQSRPENISHSSGRIFLS